ncbi:MAG: glycosyl transferase family 1 [Candidatus Eremiobacteraeota bacterium]|nr:glycosyl transferase family 1 [Candidatus Eremiobacteraeota bacterium]
MTSRAVLVVGMHRSGTSAIARGLAALGVYLGNDFLDAQPENPTGYWEDKGIVEIDERVLKALNLRWDDAAPIGPAGFRRLRIRMLQFAAARYLKRTFASHPLWGFKDPRTIRLLPFWRAVLRSCRADDAYVLAIRNPRSIEHSLFRRQSMNAATAQRLWLVHMVPYLHLIRGRPMVVVDYDLLMREPRPQLERIARRLDLPEPDPREIDRFVAEFLDETLRHSVFAPDDDAGAPTELGRLTQHAYRLLYDLAMDRYDPSDNSFWMAWEEIERAYGSSSAEC